MGFTGAVYTTMSWRCTILKKSKKECKTIPQPHLHVLVALASNLHALKHVVRVNAHLLLAAAAHNVQLAAHLRPQRFQQPGAQRTCGLLPHVI
jgi:hypothetical protein